MKYNVQTNCYINFILKDKKGSRTIYDKIVSITQTQAKNRWNSELGYFTNDELKTYNLNLKYIDETKLRNFQFKINNKISVTNSFLYEMNKVDNDLCSYCRKETESILHLLFTCDIVREIFDI